MCIIKLQNGGFHNPGIATISFLLCVRILDSFYLCWVSYFGSGSLIYLLIFSSAISTLFLFELLLTILLKYLQSERDHDRLGIDQEKLQSLRRSHLIKLEENRNEDNNNNS